MSHRFEEDVRAFEAQDQLDPPPRNAVLFVGSSSIRLWHTLDTDFSGIPVINRGFGGAQFSDVIHYLDRIVLPYRPRTVAIYAGSHDLRRAGGGPAEVLRTFTAFKDAVHAALPTTQLCYISMKPSRSKWGTIHLDREANRLLAEYAARTPRVAFIDIWTPMVCESAPPPARYFAEDGNHLSRAGYALWAQTIRPFIAP